MLLIGGICIFVLPVSQYPQITPAQVQVTTTYTGADALTVAEKVTTSIDELMSLFFCLGLMSGLCPQA
jgi:HAE1 family hydrophobic/amphiphilic exporter-1